MTRPGVAASGGTDAPELRVLVLTNMYPTPAEPGFGCFVRDQVDDLRALGIAVDVLAFDGRPKRSRYVGAGRRLRTRLRLRRYDIVHAHYGLTGAVAASQLRTPVVTTFHGSDAWIPWQRTVSRLVARRTQPIAVAPVIADSIGVAPPRVIPCAVDLHLFAPVDRDGSALRSDGRGTALHSSSRGAWRHHQGVQKAGTPLRRRGRPVAGRGSRGIRRQPRWALPRRGRPRDERSGCGRHDVTVGGRACGCEGGARLSDAGRLRRGRRCS